MAENSAGVVEPRTPVLHIESEIHPADADGQWRLVTEAIKRDLVTQPQVAAALSSFVATPVSETLPKQALDNIAQTDQRVARLTNRYQDKLGAVLNLPPVPDDQLVPDITYTTRLETVGDIKRKLKDFGQEEGSPKFEEYLRGDIELANKYGRFSRGITFQERELIAQRYRFARDIKILALGAEILLQPAGSVQFDESGKVTLPSGTQISVDTNQAAQRADMINPLLWEKRKKLKDRIHLIEVAGRRYILKEKKTARHTDTKRHGHQDGLTSGEEFATARYFRKHGLVEEGRIILNWERPIGFVTYPDGFQFTIFEYEENLIDSSFWGNITTNLRDQIVEHKDEFETEYNQIKTEAQKYKADIEIRPEEEAYYTAMLQATTKGRFASSIRSVLRRWIRRPEPTSLTRAEMEDQLTFDQFALLKAHTLVEQAQELYDRTIYGNNYNNNDQDGTAFRFRTEKGLQLEAIGFDFEYFRKSDPDKAAEDLARITESRREGSWKFRHISNIRRIEKAAYRAMLAKDGRVPKNIA